MVMEYGSVGCVDEDISRLRGGKIFTSGHPVLFKRQTFCCVLLNLDRGKLDPYCRVALVLLKEE